MNRPCDKVATCDTDIDDPLGFDGYNSQVDDPAGGPCANAVNCAGVDDPITNYSSEFDDDGEFFQDILECVCVDDIYSIKIRAPGFIGPFTWDLVGDLPPGLVFYENIPTEGDLTISGGFLSAGHYAFEIRLTDGWGNVFVKEAVFNVLEILTTDLPAPVVGTEYSFQMVATGGSGNYAWRIVDGWLPDGLFLGTDGFIGGTPTTADTVPVSIQVVDTSCVFVLDDTFSQVPKISMVGRSLTTIATTIGFHEFVASGTLPPPKYKKMNWAGTTSQTFTAVVPPQPSLGVHGDIGITYSGDSTINPDGSTGLYRQADGGTPCLSTVYTTPAGRCLGPGLTDWHGDFGGIDSQNWRWNFMVGDWPPTFQSPLVQTTNRQDGFPFNFPVAGSRIVAVGVGIYNHNFTQTLSDEYTEAEALANAITAASEGLAALNQPRTTGFVSRYTTCEYDLVCTNLLLNKAYVVTVTLISSDGTVVPRTYNFTTGTDEATSKTHTITDTIPTPALGQFTLVSNPLIDFA